MKKMMFILMAATLFVTGCGNDVEKDNPIKEDVNQVEEYKVVKTKLDDFAEINYDEGKFIYYTESEAGLIESTKESTEEVINKYIISLFESAVEVTLPSKNLETKHKVNFSNLEVALLSDKSFYIRYGEDLKTVKVFESESDVNLITNYETKIK